MTDSNVLFSPTLISPEVSSSLPESYTLRPLQRSDYHAGFLDVLRVLTTVGDFSEERWLEQYEWMRRRNVEGSDGGHGEYFVLIIFDGTRVVATGSLVVERKL